MRRVLMLRLVIPICGDLQKLWILKILVGRKGLAGSLVERSRSRSWVIGSKAVFTWCRFKSLVMQFVIVLWALNVLRCRALLIAYFAYPLLCSARSVYLSFCSSTVKTSAIPSKMFLSPSVSVESDVGVDFRQILCPSHPSPSVETRIVQLFLYSWMDLVHAVHEFGQVFFYVETNPRRAESTRENIFLGAVAWVSKVSMYQLANCRSPYMTSPQLHHPITDIILGSAGSTSLWACVR